MGFPRKMSIRNSSEIRHVIDNGIRFADGPLKIHLLQIENGAPFRAAFAVPKYGNNIVERNRLKRRLQELVRMNPVSSEGCLIVVRVSAAAYNSSFQDLKKRYLSLIEKINRTRI